MLQFSKRLQSKGARATLVTTRFVFSTTMQDLSVPISIATISDGFDERGPTQAKPGEYLPRFREFGSATLAELVESCRRSGHPVDCIVYDPFMPWALDVAKKLGLVGTAFFTQSCAVNFAYHSFHAGELKLPVSPGSEFLVPGLPPLRDSDLPSFITGGEPYRRYLDVVVNQFSNVSKADWVLCNTFDKLEEEVYKIDCIAYSNFHASPRIGLYIYNTIVLLVVNKSRLYCICIICLK